MSTITTPTGVQRFNARFFTAMDGYLDRSLRDVKRHVLADLPELVVEIGPGTGANLRYLAAGTRLVAVEPNPAMHRELAARAADRGVDLDLRPVGIEEAGLPTGSVSAVVSSLVLCSVDDPAAVLREIARILRPGGRFCFVEHVAAAPRTPTRLVQRAARRPWAWMFDGCSCERDVAGLVRGAGFAEVDLRPYRLHTPFLPFNTHVAGVARA